MIKEDKIYRFVIEILHKLGNNLCVCFRLKVKSFGLLLNCELPSSLLFFLYFLHFAEFVLSTRRSM